MRGAQNHEDKPMSNHPASGAIRLPEPSLADRTFSPRSKGHCTADVVIDERCLHVESHTELVALLCLRAAPGVVAVREQQLYEWFDHDGVVHDYFFDLMADYEDGRTVAYAVRPVARLSLHYRTQMEIIRQQALSEGAFDDVRFLTERSFDASTRHNAALLHGSRHPDPDVDSAARTVVREMSGTATVADLRTRIGHGGAGFRAVVRLVRAGILAPLRHERLTSSTLLLKKEQVQ